MRRSRLQPLIAVFCALFLLGAQQVAYAHFLSHLGIAAETAARDGGDADHGAASTLSHVCTACAAFAALEAAPPAAGAAVPAGSPAPAILAPGFAAGDSARQTPPYAPRAPPAIL